jgi:hypothetical protein
MKKYTIINVGTKVFFEGWKSGLFVKFGLLPCSWIRIRIPDPYPDPESQINPDPDPQHCFLSVSSGTKSYLNFFLFQTPLNLVFYHNFIPIIDIRDGFVALFYSIVKCEIKLIMFRFIV